MDRSGEFSPGETKGRLVTNDYALPFEGQRFRIARQGITAGLRGSRVRLKKRLEGTETSFAGDAEVQKS